MIEQSSEFTEELSRIQKLVEIYNKVAICGMRKSGVSHIIRQYLSTLEDRELVISPKVSFFKKAITAGKKLFVALPDFSTESVDYRLQFQRFLNRNSGADIQSLIQISLNQHLNLETEFKTSLKPIKKIMIVLPRGLGQTKLIIKRIAAEIDEATATEIFRLSGGNVGLTKRISQVWLEEGDISNQLLLKNQNLKILIEKLAEEYKLLNESERLELGFTNPLGQVFSPLLKEYLEKSSGMVLDTPAKRLSEFLLSNAGCDVSHDEIESILGDVSLWNRYKLIQRTAKKLSGSIRIKSIKGYGYRIYARE